jgi:peptidoglycan/LPS O-acetylase OafA/YrhL
VKQKTIEDGLNQNAGVGPGFDLLRLGLAVTIVFIHCFALANGSTEVLGYNVASAPSTPITSSVPPEDLVGWLKGTFLRKHNEDAHFANVLVPMFFALSGFLVAGSAFRTRSLTKFLTFRGLRIIPALFVEVSLSALFLGPLLTIFPLENYFHDPRLASYFGNIIGRVRYDLPGLFLTNPTPNTVNANLWTLPGEFYCYLLIAIFISSGLLFNRKLFSLLTVVGAVGLMLFDIFFRADFTSEIQRNTVFAVEFFFVGAVLFQWRSHIPLNHSLFLISSIIVYINIVAPASIHSILQYANPLFLTYLTIYLGFVKFPRVGVFQNGDYSYGIYLYGYPITQSLVAVFDQLRGHPFHLLIAALPTTFAFAMLSWHFFEKPALMLKRHFERKQTAQAA